MAGLVPAIHVFNYQDRDDVTAAYRGTFDNV